MVHHLVMVGVLYLMLACCIAWLGSNVNVNLCSIFFNIHILIYYFTNIILYGSSLSPGRCIISNVSMLHCMVRVKCECYFV